MQMLFVGKKPQLEHYGVMLLLLEEPAAKNFFAQKFEQLTSSGDYLTPWKLASVMFVQLKKKYFDIIIINNLLLRLVTA